MYVLLTTANFPDIMMPAYSKNTAYSLFFVIYMVINILILLNILLAVIYTNYRNHLKVSRTIIQSNFNFKIKIKKNEVESLINKKAKKLDEAFDRLSKEILIQENNQTIEGIEMKTFFCFLKMYNKYLSVNQINAYFRVLDEGNKSYLSIWEF